MQGAGAAGMRRLVRRGFIHAAMLLVGASPLLGPPVHAYPYPSPYPYPSESPSPYPYPYPYLSPPLSSPSPSLSPSLSLSPSSSAFGGPKLPNATRLNNTQGLSNTSKLLSCTAESFANASFALFGGWAPHARLHFEFYHDGPLQSETRGWQAGYNSTMEQCGAFELLDCHKLVIMQADVGLKGLAQFVGLVLSGDYHALNQTRAFGWLPVITVAADMLSNDAFAKYDTQQFRVEAGGGSGAGFQVYCDDEFFITAGGGGGGGLEGHFSHVNYTSVHFNFGGGGGAGVQFRYITNLREVELSNTSYNWSDWVSYGGGGGCGICDGNDTVCALASKNVICGQRFDDNCVSETDLQYSLHLVHETIDYCKAVAKLTIDGGGGGGGGTAECCEPFMYGYGFHFWGSVNVDFNASFPETQNITSERSLIENGETDTSASSNDEDHSQQYMYDRVGGLLHNASRVCSRGYDDWCCVCSSSQHLLRRCKHARALNITIEDKSARVYNDSALAKIYLTCEGLGSDLGTYNWLLYTHCCTKKSASMMVLDDDDWTRTHDIQNSSYFRDDATTDEPDVPNDSHEYTALDDRVQYTYANMPGFVCGSVKKVWPRSSRFNPWQTVVDQNQIPDVAIEMSSSRTVVLIWGVAPSGFTLLCALLLLCTLMLVLSTCTNATTCKHRFRKYSNTQQTGEYNPILSFEQPSTHRCANYSLTYLSSG